MMPAMASTYVDEQVLSTWVDRTDPRPRSWSPGSLLPGQLAELLDHFGEELADHGLVGLAHEVERVPPGRPGQRVVVLAGAPALVGQVQPDHPPVLGVAAPLHVALADQRVDDGRQGPGRGPPARSHVARLEPVAGQQDPQHAESRRADLHARP